MHIRAYAFAAAALLVLGSGMEASAQKYRGGGGFSGRASFTGVCGGQYRHVYVCLGPGGAYGTRRFVLAPGQRRIIGAPSGSSYNSVCGAPARGGCPGPYRVERF